MSRLYGRSDDVYNVSKFLVEKELMDYPLDCRKVKLEDIKNSVSVIDMYLPECAIDFIAKTPIIVARDLFSREPYTFFPKKKKDVAQITFPMWRVINEYRNDFLVFTGRLLASYSPDYMPDDFNIPCECHDVISLLIDYLFKKENGTEDNFSLKYLHDLVYNARNFIKVYEQYDNYLTARQENRYYGFDDRIEKYAESNKKAILFKTLQSLVPLASLDTTLQLTDTLESPSEYKELLEKLILNPNHNRTEILKDMGIESYGFRRLIKEVDSKRKR